MLYLVSILSENIGPEACVLKFCETSLVFNVIVHTDCGLKYL